MNILTPVAFVIIAIIAIVGNVLFFGGKTK